MNRHKRVLLLHTDEQMLMQLERVLEEMGVDTTTTWEPGEALELARSRHFDLFLVGDHPPEVSASEMLRELQCGRINIACVVLPSRRQPFAPDYFYSLGASGVVEDPDPGAVGSWVRQRLAASARAAAVPYRQ